VIWTLIVGKLAVFRCQPSRASLVGRHRQGKQGVVHGASRASSTRRAGRRPRGEQGVDHEASRASTTGRAGRRQWGDGASPLKQGVHQKYIDVLSLHRQSLQNKQCFHNPVYAYLSAARNTYNFINEYGVALRPQEAENVHKIVDIE
jgi:hypothetical protein